MRLIVSDDRLDNLPDNLALKIPPASLSFFLCPDHWYPEANGR